MSNYFDNNLKYINSFPKNLSNFSIAQQFKSKIFPDIWEKLLTVNQYKNQVRYSQDTMV